MRAVLAAFILATVGVTGQRSPRIGNNYVASAATEAVATTNAVSHGMRITMAVPLIQPLPRSALLRLRVRVTNVSAHQLELSRPCDRANPRAVVTNENGVVTYTTMRTWPVVQRCVPRPFIQLASGRSVERQNYVVLRGQLVQPVVDRVVDGRTVRVVGKAYRLPVGPQYLRPHITALFVGGGRRSVAGGRGNVPLYQTYRIAALEVESRGPTFGPLVVGESALCPGRQVLVPTWTAISRMQPRARIPAPCPRPRLWSVDYGWEGQSIGEVLVGRGNLRPTAR
ncbi:MAG: hypothetical protein M3Z66_01375 [Chloroflexota bacterium]|nr:hypothetical protein [Chloroflexota bacterium]